VMALIVLGMSVIIFGCGAYGMWHCTKNHCAGYENLLSPEEGNTP
jgi:hypothetical protein